MPRKKYPVAGEPDFHTVSDERLRHLMDAAQQLIFSYQGCDSDKVKVLKEITKDLSDENISRVSESARKEMDRQDKSTTRLLKSVKLRRSPLKK